MTPRFCALKHESFVPGKQYSHTRVTGLMVRGFERASLILKGTIISLTTFTLTSNQIREVVSFSVRVCLRGDGCKSEIHCHEITYDPK